MAPQPRPRSPPRGRSLNPGGNGDGGCGLRSGERHPGRALRPAAWHGHPGDRARLRCSPSSRSSRSPGSSSTRPRPRRTSSRRSASGSPGRLASSTTSRCCSRTSTGTGPTSSGSATRRCTPLSAASAPRRCPPLAGYGFARFSFRGSKLLFYFIIGALLVPITALTLPLYLAYAKAHLINSLWGMVLPSMVSPVGIYLMRTYVDLSVPRELIDAARIDGAGEARIFFRVALPLMVPGLMTVLLLSVVAVWNNYFLPLIIFNINNLFPLTVGIGPVVASTPANSGDANLFPMLVMGGLVTIIPLIALFLSCSGTGAAACCSAASRTKGLFVAAHFAGGADQGLRDRGDGAGRAGPGRRRRRVRRAGRAVGLRQDDGAADGRRAWRRITSGTVSFGDRVVNDVSPPASRRRHGLPELRALPAPDGGREHRLRAGRTRRSRRPSGTGGSVRPQRFSAWRSCSAASRSSCPAVSGSGWRWGGRSCARPPCS